MNSVPEIELLSRCKKGDSHAWDELFSRHYSPAARFVHQVGPTLTVEDVEEVCQETFLAVIRHLPQFQGTSQFQTWLFRIAANKTRDFVERQRAMKRGGGETPYSLDAEDPESGIKLDAPTNLPTPGEALLSNETVLLLRQGLDCLGDPCREIIELRYFGDLSYDEIAGELQMNPKTVSSRLSKCLDKLEEIARPLFETGKMGPSPVKQMH